MLRSNPFQNKKNKNDVQAPTAGATVNPVAGTDVLILRPAGALATLTVNVPSSPFNGQEITVVSTQTITTLTMGGGTIIGAPTTLAAGGYAAFVFNGANSEWCRAG